MVIELEEVADLVNMITRDAVRPSNRHFDFLVVRHDKVVAVYVNRKGDSETVKSADFVPEELMGLSVPDFVDLIRGRIEDAVRLLTNSKPFLSEGEPDG